MYGIKNTIHTALKESSSIRIGYWSRARTIYVDFEQDAQANTHVVYRNTGKENVKQAFISANSKNYFSNGDGDWKEKSPANFDYKAWIDSCQHASLIFEQPFSFCQLDRDITITGTPYSVFKTVIANDTFHIWVNKNNQKLERINGENKQKGVKLEWIFDLPFNITEPSVGLKNTYNYGFSVFPPSYSESEDFDGNTPVFHISDKLPEYQGGQAQLFKTIGNNIRYPNFARKNNIEGTVYIGFVVETDGKMSNYQIKRGVSKDCDAEALRVVKYLSGNWEPGIFQSQKVRVAYTLPIKFKLED